MLNCGCITWPVGFKRLSLPNCRLEVRNRKVLRPASWVKFPMVFLGRRASTVLVPNIHVALHAPANSNFRISAQTQSSQHYQSFATLLPSKHRMQPKRSVPPICCTLPTVHFPSPYLLHFPTLYFASSLPLQVGRAELPENLQSDNFFRPITTNVQPLTTLSASTPSSWCSKR